jgi:hypothetical protein
MDILTRKMYVPDPKTWIDYYRNASTGYVNPFNAYGNKNQRGGGLMNSPKQHLIPIENSTHEKPTTTPDLPKMEFISPAEQVVQQAKDELKMGIKRKNNPPSVIPLKKRRGNTSKGRKSKKIKASTTKRNSKKKHPSKSKKSPPQKRLKKRKPVTKRSTSKNNFFA